MNNDIDNSPNSTMPTKPPISQWGSFNRDVRRHLIEEIESSTKRSLICYVTQSAQISSEDVLYVRELLHPLQPGTPIDLLLNSPGGDVDAAEKLVYMIRQVIAPPDGDIPEAEFRLIVPDRAKSAATLIGLGANSIVMGNTSELGPIDPQVILPDKDGNRRWYSVFDYIDAYDEAKDNYRSNPTDSVFKNVIDKFDPVLLRKLEQVKDRVRSCAEDLLKPHGVNFSLIPDLLMDTDKYPSHGQMIGWAAAKNDIELNIDYLDGDNVLWQAYWNLYCCLLKAVEGHRKIFESVNLTNTI